MKKVLFSSLIFSILFIFTSCDYSNNIVNEDQCLISRIQNGYVDDNNLILLSGGHEIISIDKNNKTSCYKPDSLLFRTALLKLKKHLNVNKLTYGSLTETNSIEYEICDIDIHQNSISYLLKTLNFIHKFDSFSNVRERQGYYGVFVVTLPLADFYEYHSSNIESHEISVIDYFEDSVNMFNMYLCFNREDSFITVGNIPQSENALNSVAIQYQKHGDTYTKFKQLHLTPKQIYNRRFITYDSFDISRINFKELSQGQNIVFSGNKIFNSQNAKLLYQCEGQEEIMDLSYEENKNIYTLIVKASFRNQGDSIYCRHLNNQFETVKNISVPNIHKAQMLKLNKNQLYVLYKQNENYYLDRLNIDAFE